MEYGNRVRIIDAESEFYKKYGKIITADGAMKAFVSVVLEEDLGIQRVHVDYLLDLDCESDIRDNVERNTKMFSNELDSLINEYKGLIDNSDMRLVLERMIKKLN